MSIRIVRRDNSSLFKLLLSPILFLIYFIIFIIVISQFLNLIDSYDLMDNQLNLISTIMPTVESVYSGDIMDKIESGELDLSDLEQKLKNIERNMTQNIESNLAEREPYSKKDKQENIIKSEHNELVIPDKEYIVVWPFIRDFVLLPLFFVILILLIIAVFFYYKLVRFIVKKRIITLQKKVSTIKKDIAQCKLELKIRPEIKHVYKYKIKHYKYVISQLNAEINFLGHLLSFRKSLKLRKKR